MNISALRSVFFELSELLGVMMYVCRYTVEMGDNNRFWVQCTQQSVGQHKLISLLSPVDTEITEVQCKYSDERQLLDNWSGRGLREGVQQEGPGGGREGRADRHQPPGRDQPLLGVPAGDGPEMTGKNLSALCKYGIISNQVLRPTTFQQGQT